VSGTLDENIEERDGIDDGEGETEELLSKTVVSVEKGKKEQRKEADERYSPPRSRN
jgi:hypothetical protein